MVHFAMQSCPRILSSVVPFQLGGGDAQKRGDAALRSFVSHTLRSVEFFKRAQSKGLQPGARATLARATGARRAAGPDTVGGWRRPTPRDGADREAVATWLR